MSTPNLDNIIDYGQYGSGTTAYGTYDTGANLTPKPTDSISISLEFLRGVDAAAKWAHDNYSTAERLDILDGAVSVEVARLHEEATK